MFNNDTDGQLKGVVVSDLGQARRVVVTRDTTSIIDGMPSRIMLSRGSTLFEAD